MGRGDLKWALDTVAGNLTAYALGRDYYRGKHRITFSSEKWRNTFGEQVAQLRDNLCPAVVDALADRVLLEGFAGAQEAQVQEVWRENDLDRLQGSVHLQAFRDGDAYLMVWPDSKGVPRFYPQPADRMAVRYSDDDPTLLELAAKVWPEVSRSETDGKEEVLYRANLYYADRIEKWVQRQATTPTTPGAAVSIPTDLNAWEEYREPAREGEEPGEDGLGSWPVTHEYGQVPVFHFLNDALPGEPGKSELADVIPLQDALNKSLADMMVAQETHALPQRHATGLEVEVVVQPDGSEVEKAPEWKPGGLWYSANKDTRFGEFSAANLEALIKVQDSLRSEIARVSRTPIHYLILSGTFPSGEALRTAEAPLEAKANDRQNGFGPTWEGAMSFALRIKGNRDPEATEARLSAVWKDTRSEGEKEKAETLAMHREAGISRRRHLRELGYSEDDIVAMEEEADEEAQEAQAAFDAGQVNLGTPPNVDLADPNQAPPSRTFPGG